MEFDFTQDMTMILNNAAVVFANQAKLAREQSAATLANPYCASGQARLTQIRILSDQFLEAAAVWDERAAAARKGNLLMSPSEYADTAYLSTFKDLITQCQKAGRLLITTPLDKELNDPMPIPVGAFDSDGMPTDVGAVPGLSPAARRQARLDALPGQTQGFDSNGMPIIS